MEQGLKILINTYWGSGGWKSGEISETDFEIAKSQGYMFDYPLHRSHEDTLWYTKELVEKINAVDVANAFLYSLSTRKLEYRSALGSYYYARSIPFHKLESSYGKCSICGFFGYKEIPKKYDKSRGLNVLNFERYKWGGVRHDYLDYVVFDLEQFILLTKVIPCEHDFKIFDTILELSKQVEDNQKIGTLSKLIVSSKLFKTNKSEVDSMLGILAICDIFNSVENRGYLNCFTNANGSRDPVEYKNDYAFPANRWHGYDGINYEAVSQVFGIHKI